MPKEALILLRSMQFIPFCGAVEGLGRVFLLGKAGQLFSGKVTSQCPAQVPVVFHPGST